MTIPFYVANSETWRPIDMDGWYSSSSWLRFFSGAKRWWPSTRDTSTVWRRTLWPWAEPLNNSVMSTLVLGTGCLVVATTSSLILSNMCMRITIWNMLPVICSNIALGLTDIINRIHMKNDFYRTKPSVVKFYIFHHLPLILVIICVLWQGERDLP